MVQQPVVDERLRLRNETSSGDGTPLFPRDVNETTATATHGFLTQRTRDQLSLLDAHRRVLDAKVVVVSVFRPRARSLEIHLRKHHAEHLLTRPQRLWFENGRLRHLTVPVFEPHDDVHEDVLGDERVALGDQTATQKRILHDGHDRLVRLRRHDHLRNHHQLFDFRPGLV